VSVVTAIERQRRRRRFNVYVDGEFALALEAETLARSGLKVGTPVAGNQLLELAADDLRRRAFDAALHLLSYRPRSEHEIRTRLLRRGLPPDVVGAAVEKLRDDGLVNDAAFARAWVEGRTGASPRGRELLRRELRRKGVDAATATEAVAAVSEEEAARRAALKQVRALRGLAYRDFRNRLAGYLQRRGFGYDVIRPIVAELWQRQGGAVPDEPWDDG
jgi:regulatory protein